jgi:hypothetical protein
MHEIRNLPVDRRTPGDSMANGTKTRTARAPRRPRPLAALCIALVVVLASLSVLWAWTRTLDLQTPAPAIELGAMPDAAPIRATPRTDDLDPGVARDARIDVVGTPPARTQALRGIVRVDGVGRAGVDVVLAEIDDRALPRRAGRSWRLQTDALGRFSVENGPDSGTLRVEAVAPGCARARADVAIPADEPADEIVLDLEPLATRFARVHGVVVNADGTPARRARVALGATRTLADRDGRFELEIENADPGADLVAVVAGAQPVVRADFGARLAPGADLALQLVIEGPSASISGVLSDSSGAPLKNWKVAVEGDDPAGAALGREPARTNARGEFSIEGLSQGTYALRAWKRRNGDVASLAGVDAGASGVELRVP